MKKRFGFTLAEVLITLGIVGVVAALTAPALVKNSSQAKVGPSLAKFVNTWENAVDALLADEDVNTLTDVNDSSSASTVMEALGNYAPIIPFQDGETYTYTEDDGYGNEMSTTYTMGDDNGDNGLYKLGENFVIAYLGVGYNEAYKGQRGVYRGSSAFLIVDIDGVGGKNKGGVDVFRFELDDTGRLVPYGGNTYLYLTGKEAKDITYPSLAKTGEIADNGWKVPKKK